MKSIRPIWFWSAGAILLVLLVGGFFLVFEQVDETVHKFPSKEAAQNRYLALERLVDAAGFDAKTYPYVGDPEQDRVVFLADPSTRPSPEQVEDWVDWVEEQGGHLIFSVPDDNRDESTAPLLPRLGFRQASSETSDDAKSSFWPQDISKKRYATRGNLPASEPAKAGGEEEDSKAEEKNDEAHKRAVPPGLISGWGAEDADWLAVNESGQVLAASRIARMGRVTLLRSAEYFDNEHIGDGEHASLAADIARLEWLEGYDKEAPDLEELGLEVEQLGPAFSIVLYGERHSWMAYVFGFIWPALATLFIILLFAIQRGRRRFGPVIANASPQRRSRMEHIEAVGRFLWKHDASDDLVLATQRTLLRELERRNPQLRSATGIARWEIIAMMLDVDIAQARQLFQIPQNERRAERFTAQIRALESYRRQL